MPDAVLVRIGLGVVHRVHGVAAPREVDADPPHDHILLAAVHFKAVEVLFEREQRVLGLFDGRLVRAVHDLGDFRVVSGVVLVVRRHVRRVVFLLQPHQLVAVDVRHAEEVRVAHAVLDGRRGGAPLLPEPRPAGQVLLDRLAQFRVIDEAHRAPHIGDGVLRPAVRLEQVADIGGAVFRVVALGQERLGERFGHALVDHLHDHVIGGADEVVRAGVDLQLVVHILVGAEGGVLHADGSARPRLVIFFKFRDEVDAVVLSLGRGADVVLPVIDAQHLDILGRAPREREHGGEQHGAGERRRQQTSFHLEASFPAAGLRARRLIASTTAIITMKMSADSARSAGVELFVPFLTAL